MKAVPLLLMLSLTGLASSMAHADGPPSNPDGWQYRIGAGVVITPESIGSSSTRYMPVPYVDIRYKDWFFLNPVDGVGVRHKFGGLSASISLADDRNNREPSAGKKYRGLRPLSETAAARLKLDYDLGKFTTSAIVSSRLSNSVRRGTTLELEGGYNFVTSPDLRINAGVTARLMDSTFAKNLISVSPKDSLSSGLPVYRAGSGLLDAGVYAEGNYRLNDKWNVFSRIAVARLEGDAKRAPFVEKRTGTTFILFASYTF